MTAVQLKSIKSAYPAGTRIHLDRTLDDPQPIAAGQEGTVTAVDDMGQLCMRWDNGRSLSLIPGTDEFHVVEKKPMSMDDILACIRGLAQSQGMYGRLYRDLMEIKQENPFRYSEIARALEARKFVTDLDFILAFEGGEL